jgi:hypothetical protein
LHMALLFTILYISTSLLQQPYINYLHHALKTSLIPSTVGEVDFLDFFISNNLILIGKRILRLPVQ